MNDTIAALASASGSARRGIIRMSGQNVLACLGALFSGVEESIHPKQARRYEMSLEIDTAIFLPVAVHVWPTSRSFTGEPLVELHVLGSPPLLNEVLGRILTLGARPAERGEFTLRAFLAGRIDLVQAEAVLGVIDAGNETELQTALEQLAGGVSGQIGAVREELLLHLADLEAGLDFVEEDIEFVQRPELIRRLTETAQLLTILLSQSADRMQSTGRAKVVLAGLPNAGKSTLFNTLAGAQAAIVSHEAGTTRDYLSAVIEDSQRTYELIDTAGWEETRDGIEAAAAMLRHDQFQRADLIVWCAASLSNSDEQAENDRLLQECRDLNSNLLVVITKVDLEDDPRAKNPSVVTQSLQRVSAETGAGIDDLHVAIQTRLLDTHASSEIIGATAARCRESLQHALLATQQAKELAEIRAGDELISLELRDVLEHLGRIVGKVYTDDILDRIFSRFCIGK